MSAKTWFALVLWACIIGVLLGIIYHTARIH